MAHETFPFHRLMPEIRLLVWEQTWPESRVVEVGLCDNQDWEDQSSGDDEPTEYMSLRPSSTITTFLGCDFGSRVVEDSAIEKCPDPIALHICRESRAATLRHYFPMTHSKLGRSFYLNPDRDILWLSTDMTDCLGDFEILRSYYAECWGRIRRVLVSWEEYASNSYPKRVLAHVSGLQVVQVLVNDDGNNSDVDDGGDQGMTEAQVEAENQEEPASQDETMKEDGTEEVDPDMRFAREMMERDDAMKRGFPWTVQYIDQKGNVFCQWSKAHGAVEGVCV